MCKSSSKAINNKIKGNNSNKIKMVEENKEENKEEKRKISIYTDGSCTNNGKINSIGRFGYICIENDNIVHTELNMEKVTTNNKMEMKAILSALNYLKTINYDYCDIFTDSRLVKKGLTEWYPDWKKRNFKNIKNVELWKELYSIYSSTSNIKIKWVRGHSDNKWNNYIDSQLKKNKY